MIGRFRRPVRVSKMSLKKMLVTVGFVTTFVRALEIPSVEVRDVIMCCKGLFLFNPRLSGDRNGSGRRELPI